VVPARVICVGVVALAVAVTAPAAAVPPVAPRVVTQAHTGKTFRLAKGRELTLRLAGRWVWSEPRSSARGVEITPVEYFVDPGFQEWQVGFASRGTVKISSVGTPACENCGLPIRRFRVTLRVA